MFWSRYYAVKPRGAPEWVWATEFIHYSEGICSLPSREECWVNIFDYDFKTLTYADYKLHIEVGSLTHRDSDVLNEPQR